MVRGRLHLRLSSRRALPKGTYVLIVAVARRSGAPTVIRRTVRVA
jgi:hypothetical protein